MELLCSRIRLHIYAVGYLSRVCRATANYNPGQQMTSYEILNNNTRIRLICYIYTVIAQCKAIIRVVLRCSFYDTT